MLAKLTYHCCDRQAYVVFKTPQAATAAKHKVEGFGEGQKYRQKFLVNYTNPYTNPFKTLPKDGPTRNGPPSNRSSSVGYNSSGSIGVTQQQAGYNVNSGYRGRGGGFNNRGTMSNMSGYTRPSFQQPMPGSYQSGGVNGYQAGPVGPLPQYGGFQGRGGLMGGMRSATIGMRGGRGGMNGGGMMGIPMGGMGLGAMPVQMPQMPLNMPQMSAGMGMQGMSSHNTLLCLSIFFVLRLLQHLFSSTTLSVCLAFHSCMFPTERGSLSISHTIPSNLHIIRKYVKGTHAKRPILLEALHCQQSLHYLPNSRSSGVLYHKYAVMTYMPIANNELVTIIHSSLLKHTILRPRSLVWKAFLFRPSNRGDPLSSQPGTLRALPPK